MRLAEALSIRVDLQKRISSLKGRIKDSAKIQEGDSPSEELMELNKELGDSLSKLEDIIYRINVTNMHTVHKGESLTKLIAKKDMLSLRVSIMRDVLAHVVEVESRYGMNEVKYVRVLDVAEYRKEVDSYSRQLRELDLEIQQMNWMVDLK
jgi:hypothetical protein